MSRVLKNVICGHLPAVPGLQNLRWAENSPLARDCKVVGLFLRGTAQLPTQTKRDDSGSAIPGFVSTTPVRAGRGADASGPSVG